MSDAEIHDAAARGPAGSTLTVALCIHGEDLDPDGVTAALGARPDRAWRRGDVHVGEGGREVVRRRGPWTITRHEPLTSVSDQARSLLDAVSLARPLPEMRPAVDPAILDLLAQVDLADPEPRDLVLDAGLVARAGRAGFDVEVTVQCYEGDEPAGWPS